METHWEFRLLGIVFSFSSCGFMCFMKRRGGRFGVGGHFVARPPFWETIGAGLVFVRVLFIEAIANTALPIVFHYYYQLDWPLNFSHDAKEFRDLRCPNF